MSIYLRLPETPRTYFWVSVVVALAFVAAGVQQIGSNVDELRHAHAIHDQRASATAAAGSETSAGRAAAAKPSAVSWIESAAWIVVAGPLLLIARRQRRRI